MMNKNYTNAQTASSHAMEMLKTALVSFSFAPITVFAMIMVSSLCL